jgi:ATP:ADP antiporter, AAA family
VRDFLLRLLRLRDATAAERAATGWTAVFFFCVLCAYYLLRPLRDEVGSVFGKGNLLSLFTLTFVLITLLNTPYMLLANRLPPSRFIARVLHGFAASFVVLGAAIAWLPPLQQGVFGWDRPECLVGAFFYSWVTAFSVCGVVLVWVHAVDYFTTQQGKRLFGLVSVGGTIGAITASALAWFSSQLPLAGVIVAAALVLELGILAYRRSLLACEHMVGGSVQQAPRIASAGVFAGLKQLVESRYLLGIASFVLCSALVATSFYYVMNGLVEEQLPAGQQRRALFSMVNLLQNLGSLVIQVWVTRTALMRLGIAAVLCIMPLVSLLGLSLAAVLPVVGVMAGFEVLRRMMQFAFDKPGREVLFTPLDREAKYKSKAFIDTVVLRSGDLLGAFLNDALVERGFGYRTLALGSVPLVVGWAWLGIWLGRTCQRKERQPPS